METKKFKFERTKSGLAARWEYGGGTTNCGEASVICDNNGLPKKAIYVKRSGHLCNHNHALITIAIGDFIIWTSHKRRDFWTKVYRIQNIDFNTEHANCELLYEYSNGEWNSPLPTYLQPAISAGMEKATCYHCRSAHYIVEN